jgi:hypothetical protein
MRLAKFEPGSMRLLEIRRVLQLSLVKRTGGVRLGRATNQGHTDQDEA